MSWILQINTSLENASLSLALNGELIAEKSNDFQKEHASFLHPAILSLLAEAGITASQLVTVAVVEGPGSYTGIRLGMATAKGLCFALDKPLITISSLQLLAATAKSQLIDYKPDELICPMIDARRMEVFTGIYNSTLKSVMEPCAMELTEFSFAHWLLTQKIYFTGNGAAKWAKICSHQNSCFIEVENYSPAFSKLVWLQFLSASFSSVAYAEPAYLKEFFSTAYKI